MKYPFYLYEHTNGEIIAKASVVCEFGTYPAEYFDSPFVKRWQRIDSEEQEKIFRAKSESKKEG